MALVHQREVKPQLTTSPISSSLITSRDQQSKSNKA